MRLMVIMVRWVGGGLVAFGRSEPKHGVTSSLVIPTVRAAMDVTLINSLKMVEGKEVALRAEAPLVVDKVDSAIEEAVSLVVAKIMAGSLVVGSLGAGKIVARSLVVDRVAGTRVMALIKAALNGAARAVANRTVANRTVANRTVTAKAVALTHQAETLGATLAPAMLKLAKRTGAEQRPQRPQIRQGKRTLQTHGVGARGVAAVVMVEVTLMVVALMVAVALTPTPLT